MSRPASEVGASLAPTRPPQVIPDPHGKLYVLLPYQTKEALTLQEAARIANRSVSTLRTWCAVHHIGRRVGPGGAWQVSRPALQMLLDGDHRTLAAYVSGERGGAVRHYFDLVGLGHLLPKGGA